ncbi:SDR family NAD(P)-dependent oxidoreductase [Gynuella sunshinyii]|uniref:PKS n=1 Tax=Gynuella sunshinyii YC6258 TaxID=1445510 RepID=A0A0C5VLC0_9GAMM|nr:SDR family NAD(P)-dependent oxidoreductase [Gynuella sunshinyii]AJQ95101.1 polyketide synthase modules-related protein [Gynuella sunshinyii YC6258]DAC80076.1 TPA_exp: PKS [Gynuella sunshinyii YC6258]
MSEHHSSSLALIRQWASKSIAAEAPSTSGSDSTAHPADVVITGVSGFFPGCMDVAGFWQALEQNQPLIAELKTSRPELYQALQTTGLQTTGQPVIEWGGFIPQISRFDPDFFKLLPLEAEEMDPRQRLLLISAWQTLRDAGLEPASLKQSRTGVFIGAEGNEYGQLMHQQGYVPGLGLGQADSMLANRISYQFDFSGPSELINATCAGFAVALRRAVDMLRAGQIDRALVGAANIMLLPQPFQALAAAGQLSRQATVHSFGQSGDGFIRSEGVGTILLERAQGVQQSGRGWYAGVRQCVENFNGQGGVSMASPNVDAHAELIQHCYRSAGIDPRQLGYIEAQGMGLPVADMAEWSAFNRALSRLCDEQGRSFEPGFCRISSLKPVIGHMHSASALGALLKIIHAFRHNRIQPLAGFTEANEYCRQDDVPCRLLTEAENWPESRTPRLAALHSFGSSGNNVHVLLQDAPPEHRKALPTAADICRDPLKNAVPCWFSVPAVAGIASANASPEAVLQQIQQWLGLDPAQPALVQQPFSELGLDSVSVAAFVTRLAETFKVRVRQSDIFSHATPQAMAEFVAAQQARAETVIKLSPALPQQDDIAIIGMSLRLAGADCVEDYWELLREGRSTIAPIPPTRMEMAMDGSVQGAFLADIRGFDPLFFKISPQEAEAMDPRQRLLLMLAWEAIEDAGYNADEWRDARHGIFLGLDESDYPVDASSSITSVHSGTAPARLGYFLDTKGPLMAISTACSSALVALHYACQSMLQGESEQALVGGCHLICQPQRTFAALASMGSMLSSDYTCYAFDHRANGMVLGEGAGIVLLKRLSQAQADGDSIYAVIKGSGINYDGKTNGLTAPNGRRQQELYQQVYQQAGVSAGGIGYVVAHGTGTELGDPVEANALIDAFQQAGAVTHQCALTSPKCNIGHTQAASGIINLITAALALKHQQIPPALNYSQANADIDFDHSPFYLNTRLQDWNPQWPLAAVSAFGHTGTNAHAVLAAAPQTAKRPQIQQAPAYPVILSAQTETSLRRMAARLLATPLQDTDLTDLAYTLQVGRQAMPVRLGLIADSVTTLRQQLTAFINRRNADDRYFFSIDAIGVSDDRDDLYRVAAHQLDHERCRQLLQCWISGVRVDWSRLYAQPAQRLHLPTYGFDLQPYWLASAGQPVMADATADNGSAETPTMATRVFEEQWQTFEPQISRSPLRTVVLCVPTGMNDQDQITASLQQFLASDTEEAPVIECIALAPGAFADQHRLLTDAFAGLETDTVDAVMDFRLWADHADMADYQQVGVLALLQALKASKLAVARLMIPVPFDDEPGRCHVDALMALTPSLASVWPQTPVSIIGLQGRATTNLSRLWPLLHAPQPCSALLIQEQWQRPVIQPLSLVAADAVINPVVFKHRGRYLITGGLGRLGLCFARYLARHVQAELWLTTRTLLDDAANSAIVELRQLGAQVQVLHMDMSDRESMAAALTELQLDGVIHAAGQKTRQTLFQQTVEDWQAMLAAKVSGTQWLDELLADQPLDFFACFSSNAAVLGDAGSGSYALGNRFEMAYIRYRNQLRSQGRRQGKAMVVNWPVWADEHGQVDQQTRFYLNSSGQQALLQAQGVALFSEFLAQPATQFLPLIGRADAMERMLGLAPVQIPKAPAGPDITLDARPELLGLSLEQKVHWDLQQLVSRQLKIPTQRLRLDSSLDDFGYDSLRLADLATHLQAHFGVAVSPALFFSCFTLRALTDHLLSEHADAVQQCYAAVTSASVANHGAKPDDSRQQHLSPAVVRHHNTGEPEPIAIIGMSGRFPGARNIQELWAILAAGECVVDEVPDSRFDWREYYGDPKTDRRRSNGKWGGFIPGVDEFDPLFFEISPREAQGMDPRQRLLLQEAWNALEDAAIGPGHLQQQRVGMFVGVEEGDFGLLAGAEITANHGGILASRLAYFMNFNGPVMAINTACSSGLVAAHQACLSLRAGECDLALAAAANLMLTPAGLVVMGQSEMLSDDGVCHVFDQRANGMVPGEAVTALVLKPLSTAAADGDAIYAVIRGSAVNYDGKTNGMTAPSGTAQAELIQQALQQAGIAPAAVEYIVTHGTGTRLGDPVEVNALYQAFRHSDARFGQCALTSTKSNFGHTFAASGLLSLISLVQAFRHEQIPASLHCETRSDYIDWATSPFYVNTQNRAWPERPEDPRTGAVSAFGMSGTNAHMVVQSYPQKLSSRVIRRPAYLLLLSAQTEAALQQRVDDLIAVLQQPEVELARISCTLLLGRHAFQHRLGLIAMATEDALAALLTWREQGTHPQLCQGMVAAGFSGQKVIYRQAGQWLDQLPEQPPQDYRDTLLALADLFCQGYQLPWSQLFAGTQIQRMHLPGYPFARERFPLPKTGAQSAVNTLHPLLHENLSDFAGQRYGTELNVHQWMLADHQLGGHAILPGVCQLEMARAALSDADAVAEGFRPLVFSQVVWLSPVTVPSQSLHVQIALTEQPDQVHYELFSDQEDDSQLYSQGEMSWLPVDESEPAAVPPIDLAAVRDSLAASSFSAEQCYTAFRAAGVHYGPAFQALQQMYASTDEVLARISLPSCVRDQRDAWVLHPSLMDGAFQAILGLSLAMTATAADPTPRIPYALTRLEILAPLPDSLWVWLRRRHSDASMDTVDIDLCDDDGQRLLCMTGLSIRVMQTHTPLPVLNGDEFYLRDHGGLLPGVVSLEWARQMAEDSGRPLRGLGRVVWREPVTQVQPGTPVAVELTDVSAALSDYCVYVGDICHAQGQLWFGEPANAETIDLAAIQQRCDLSLSAAEGLTLLQADLGPGLQSLTSFDYQLTPGAPEALACLQRPDDGDPSMAGDVWHPGLMNGVLQAANLLHCLECPQLPPPLPFSLDSLLIHQPLPERVWVHVCRHLAEGSRSQCYDIRVVTESGQPVLTLTGYTAIAAGADQCLYATADWQPQPLADTPATTATDPEREWLLTPMIESMPVLQARLPMVTLKPLLMPASDDLNDAAEALLLSLFQAIQTLIAEDRCRRVSLLLPESWPVALSSACVAMLKTLHQEHSSIAVKALHVHDDDGDTTALVDWLQREIADQQNNVEVRYHTQTRVRMLKSWRRVSVVTPTEPGPMAHGSVIWITGGLGGLGRLFARYLAEQGMRVVLSGRSQPEAAALAELSDGVEIDYLRCDITDVQSVTETVAQIQQRHGALHGIIHAAGVIADGYISQQSAADVRRVFAAKIRGCLTLDTATRDVDLQFLVLFSSMSGGFGNAGQIGYAAANAFLDGFAQDRNRRVRRGEAHGATLSLGWPLWRDGGMTVDAHHERLVEQRSGMTPLPTDAGMVAFAAALQAALAGDGLDHLVILHGDVERMQTRLLSPAVTAEEPSRTATTETTAADVRSLSKALAELVHAQMDIALERIDPAVELSQYGFNSLSLTEFATRVNQAFGLTLMPTLFFEYSTLQKLATHLLAQYPTACAAALSGSVPVTATTAMTAPRKAPAYRRRQIRTVSVPAATTADKAVAVIGVSGRFPGSEDLRAFWQHLQANDDLITEVPASRWRWQDYDGDPIEQPGKTRVKSAGFMADADRFDAAFFGISPREAISLDPQLRLMLETVWATIEDAGYGPSSLAGSQTGVYIGVSTSDYKDEWLRLAGQGFGASEGVGEPPLVSHFVIANRISYILDLQGPSEPIDTACSSSLVAIHRAVDAIGNGRCTQALVGGVNVIGGPGITIGASRAGMLSDDGRCKTFDASADGYGRGEGVGALMLKSLTQARADGDHIECVIRASAENHGGRANSPTSPNPTAQQALLVSAYGQAGIDPRTVGYIEAHGTGTELGDPIEVNALRAAFDELYQTHQLTVTNTHCGLGSVKANIGHLEAAAGIAGMIKVILMLRHRQIPGNPNLKQENPYLQLQGSPFYLVRETHRWPAPVDAQGRELPRRAGVSSFGIGGSNAHIVVEEYHAAQSTAPDSPQPQAIVLSARTAPALKAAAARLRDFLQHPDPSLPTLAALAWTLQHGRDAMAWRLGFMAASVAEASAVLEQFMAVENPADSSAWCYGHCGRQTDAAVAQTAPAPLPEQLQQWVQGAAADWSRWQVGQPVPGRVSLPSYPFERKRFWFAQPAAVAVTEAETQAVPVPVVEPARPEADQAAVAAISHHGEQTDAAIEAFVMESLAAMLMIDIEEIEPHTPFTELGLDSVIGVEWIHQLNRQYGLKMPATKVYDQPTVTAMVSFIRHQVLPEQQPIKSAQKFSIEEILQQVSNKQLDIERADQLIRQLEEQTAVGELI